MNLKKIKIIAVIGIFIISFISHFMYDTFPNVLFSIFFPVNESIWEHMKILFTSSLIYGIFDYILLKRNSIKFNNFRFNLFFTSFIGIFIYLIMFLPIYNLIGENMFIAIFLMLITYIITQIISYNILNANDLNIYNDISVYLIIIMFFIFAYFTYFPLNNYLFFDPIEKIYGIKKI